MNAGTERTAAGQVLVLVLGGSTAAGLEPVAAAAKRRGLRVKAVCGSEPTARVRAFVGSLDGWVGVDDLSDPRLVAAAAAQTAGGQPAAIAARDDAISAVAARAAELLGVGRPGQRGIVVGRNKLAAREVFAAAGLAGPAFSAMGCADEAAQVAEEVGLPAIIKPVNGTASHGVRPVCSVEELRCAYVGLTESTPGAFGGMYDRPVIGRRDDSALDPATTFLVEGLLRGPEYSFDLLVRDGKVERLMLLDKFLIAERYLECGFTHPPLDRTPEWVERAWAVVEAAVGALGLDNTAAHAEIIDDVELGPTMMELNPGRYGGGVLPAMIGATLGLELADELVSVLVDAPAGARTAPSLEPPVANLCFYPREPGILLRVHGLEEIARCPGVVQVTAPATPCHLSGDEEAGQLNVITQGLGTRAELLATYRHIESLITWDVRWAGWRRTSRRRGPVPEHYAE